MSASVPPPRDERPTIVIGLGSDIAGDDGAGIRALRLLAGRLQDLPGIEFLELPWAGLELLVALRGFSRGILIDSLRGGRHRPGTVVRLSEDDLAGSVRLNSFHDINYPTALALGRVLGWQLPSSLEIYAVEGERFDRFDTEISPAVGAGVERLVETLAARLRNGPAPADEENWR